MPVSSPRRFALPVLALAACIGIATPSLRAQEDASPFRIAELEEENAHLRARVAELEAALLRATEALTAAVDALGSARRTMHADASGGVMLPATPLASPDALFAALVRDYRRTFAESAPAQERRSAVAAWIESMRETMSGRVVWLVAIDELETPRQQAPSVRVRVLDAATLAPLGAPFRAEIPQRFVAAIERQNTAWAVWEMEADYAAKPTLNPERTTIGAFDHPRFIGPFAEFGDDLHWRTLGLSARARDLNAPTTTKVPGAPTNTGPAR